MNPIEILIPISLFACIFGIMYLIFNTRHRERMSLIEKGADASIFYADKKTAHSLWRLIVLNISLTMIGIGVGTGLATILYTATENDNVYPACIFLMAGTGLLISYFLSKKNAPE